MVRKFFYACAGLMCLAMTFAAGAQTAHGQMSGLQGTNVGNAYGLVTAVVNGTLVKCPASGGVEVVAPLPVGGTVVSTGFYPTLYGGYLVVYDNGDVYYRDQTIYGDTSWHHLANLVSAAGPTTTKLSTFGALKARYR